MNWRARTGMGLICAMWIASGCSRSIEQPHPAAAHPPIPPELRVNGSPMLQVHASGVQIYVLAPGGADGLPAWKLKAPEASFAGGGVRGRHYAGPTWECTTDGSKVVGRKVAEHPSPDSKSVSWLLLEATGHEGNGVLSKVSFIQRINTVGGKAPSADDAKANDEVRVPYEADYVFYGPDAMLPSANTQSDHWRSVTRPSPN